MKPEEPYRRHVAFKAVDKKKMESWLVGGGLKPFSKGDVVFEQDSEVDALYFVIRGQFRMVYRTTDERSHEVSRVGRQSVFGEVECFTNLTARVRVEACGEDFSEAILVRKALALQMLREDASICFWVLGQVASRLSMEGIDLRLRRERFGESGFARFLVNEIQKNPKLYPQMPLSEKPPGWHLMKLNFKRLEAKIGIHRSALQKYCRALQEQVEEGSNTPLIEQQGRGLKAIYFVNRPGLERVYGRLGPDELS